MVKFTMLRALALATTCLVPLTVYAADDGGGFDIDSAPVVQQQEEKPASSFNNEVTIGLKGVMGTNPDQAGRYTGQTTKGISQTLDFHLRDRSEWKSGDTWYYDATGKGIVFQDNNRLTGDFHDNSYTSQTSNNLDNNGSLSLKFGQQGLWGFSGYYDVISYTGNVIQSIYTVNGRSSTLNGGLLPWGGGTLSTEGSIVKSSITVPPVGHTAQTASSLLAAETPFQTGTRRDILGGDIKYILGDWTFTTSGRHEHKEGTMEETLNNGYAGAAFTLPVDYDTDRYDISASYNTKQMQAVIQNTYSHFIDNNNFITFDSPFSMATAPYQTTAAFSTPPSNNADYLTVMLATNALTNVRVNVNARYGVEMQNDAFAPNTADPNPLSTMTSGFDTGPGTKQTSLGAVAQVYQVNASATARPFPLTDARVFYGVDGRAVHQDVTQVAGANSQTSMDTANPVTMIATPQEWLKQKFGGTLGYKILPASDTKLTIGYTRDEVDRSNAQVGHSYTNTESIGVHSNLYDTTTTGSLTYEHGDRSGSINYMTPWVAYGVNAPNANEMYFSAAYYQAPMVSDSIKLRADYAPTRDLSTGFSVRFKNENYDYSATPTNTTYTTIGTYGQGIKNNYNLTVGPDINYRPIESVNTHFYYTYEQIFYNNYGNGACSVTNSYSTANCGALASDPGYFNNRDTSSIHTVGLDGDWHVTSKLKLGAGYTFSYGAVAFNEYNGISVATTAPKNYQNVTDYPDITSIMHSLQASASYDLMPNVELISRFTFSMFRSNDWNDYAAPVQQAGTTAVSFLTPGYGPPDYSVSTIMTGLKIKF